MAFGKLSTGLIRVERQGASIALRTKKGGFESSHVVVDWREAREMATRLLRLSHEAEEVQLRSRVGIATVSIIPDPQPWMSENDLFWLEALRAGVYTVDESGSVFRINKTKPPRQLKPTLNSSGYRRITVSYQNVQKPIDLHRAVALALIPNPDGLPVVNHDDRNRSNCSVGNLAWSTNQDNVHHSFGIGKYVGNGASHGRAKLMISQIPIIRDRVASGEKLESIAKDLGVSKSCVFDVIRGKSWGHVEKHA